MPDFLTPRIRLTKTVGSDGVRWNQRSWDLLAYGPNPYIAEIGGWDKEFTYKRWFLGSRGPGFCWTQFSEWVAPVLLDIRAEMRGWYILHGTGFDNLQLSEVSEGVIAQLLSEPLFSDGYMRILDDSLPAVKRRGRKAPKLPMFVIQSPVERYKQQMIDLAKPKSKVEVDYSAIVVSTWNDDDEPPPKKKKRPEPKRSNLPAILPHDTGRNSTSRTRLLRVRDSGRVLRAVCISIAN